MSLLNSVWTNSRRSSFSPAANPVTLCIDLLEDPLVLREEAPGDGFDIEGFGKGGGYAPCVPRAPVNPGDLLHCRALGQIPFDNHAAQGRAGAGEVGEHELNLADVPVGKDQQQVVTQIAGDQSSRLTDLDPADPVGRGAVECDIHDMHAIKFSYAFGVAREIDPFRRTTKGHRPSTLVEVQDLDEHLADCLRAPIRLRVEDAVDVRLNVGDVFKVADWRHRRSLRASRA